MNDRVYVSPDDLGTGTDRERVQWAVDTAIAHGRHVIIDRVYDLGAADVDGYALVEVKYAHGLQILGTPHGEIRCLVNGSVIQPEKTVAVEVFRLRGCSNIEFKSLSFRDLGISPHDKIDDGPFFRVGALFVSVRNPVSDSEAPNHGIAIRDCEFRGNGPTDGGAHSAVIVGYGRGARGARVASQIVVENCYVRHVRYGIVLNNTDGVRVRGFYTHNVVRTAIMFGARDVDIDAHVSDPRAARGVFGVNGARGTQNVRIKAHIKDVDVWNEINGEGAQVEKCRVRSFVHLGHNQVPPSTDNCLADIDIDLHFEQLGFGDASCVQFWSSRPLEGGETFNAARENITENRWDRVKVSGNWPRPERLIEWATRPVVPCNLDLSGLTTSASRSANGRWANYRLCNAQVWSGPSDFFVSSFEGGDAIIHLPEEIRDQPVAMDISVHAQISRQPMVGDHRAHGIFAGLFLMLVDQERQVTIESPARWHDTVKWGDPIPYPVLRSGDAPGTIAIAMPGGPAGAGVIHCRLI